MARVLRTGEDVGLCTLPGPPDPDGTRPHRQYPIEVTYRWVPVSALPRPVDNAIYRLAQESVTNAVGCVGPATRRVTIRTQGRNGPASRHR